MVDICSEFIIDRDNRMLLDILANSEKRNLDFNANLVQNFGTTDA
jgi:hypothetical protein